jgi:hypothetical protein
VEPPPPPPPHAATTIVSSVLASNGKIGRGVILPTVALQRSSRVTIAKLALPYDTGDSGHIDWPRGHLIKRTTVLFLPDLYHLNAEE